MSSDLYFVFVVAEWYIEGDRSEKTYFQVIAGKFICVTKINLFCTFQIVSLLTQRNRVDVVEYNLELICTSKVKKKCSKMNGHGESFDLQERYECLFLLNCKRHHRISFSYYLFHFNFLRAV